MEKLNLKSIKARLKADTPLFWKQVRRWMIGCGTVGTGLASSGIQLPGILLHAPEALITIGVVGTSLASLTCAPPNEKQGTEYPEH